MTDINLASLLAPRGLRLIDVARAVSVNKATVTRWAQKHVPAERVLEVERITGISRHDLRPDLYPREERAAS
ncbi:YdaS family helix-turn-helix protein [Kaistia dalseonensis]|uniref:DNA-binding transcriptional regulator YdaS (Cro superfamily) n=1 Tax=Kaistia dalseonensis TaxID=410840 RepID=A0ABU0H6Q2_9HYPH|nr:YdaS family helix-turn-helix protein [Kaistia dalseonensis]MCX5495403.1 YdaS family helix-turn-helix protein [Kaistia dalseonensis]MDQ0437992.1 DNA-binding transcriptional regulator YdaS (Cro superfamily) [Kaistia dalseonensis]